MREGTETEPKWGRVTEKVSESPAAVQGNRRLEMCACLLFELI